MCMIEDADTWKVFDAKTVEHARKEHRCTECARTIHVGEKYEYAWGLLADGPRTHKTCEHCCVTREWLQQVCNGYVFGMVLEELVEHWQDSEELRSFPLAHAIVGMRRKWQGSAGLAPVPDGDRLIASIPALAR